MAIIIGIIGIIVFIAFFSERTSHVFGWLTVFTWVFFAAFELPHIAFLIPGGLLVATIVSARLEYNRKYPRNQ